MDKEVYSYFKGFIAFCKNKLNLTLILIASVFIGIASVLYVYAGQVAQRSLNEQMLHREQVSVRAGARTIESFLRLSSRSLLLLARNDSVINQGPNTQEIMNEFIDDWADTPIVEILLVDETGEVLFVANKEGTGMKPGVNVSDRDYFNAAKLAKKGDIFFGEPILPRLGGFEGQYISTITTPIYQNGEFRGLVGAAILLSELTNSYLESLKITENTRVYLVNQDGVMLHAPHEKFVGANYFEYLSRNPFEGAEIAEIELREAVAGLDEGKLNIVLPNEYTGELTRFLIAHSVVRYNGDHWTLALATPERDALVFFSPFHISQTIALFTVISVVVVFSSLVVLGVRLAEKKAYIKGRR